MPESQCSARGLTLAQAVAALLLLLAPRIVDGIHCLLLDPSSSANDITQYVSLCALCSHNEAAVRWNRTEEDTQLSFRAFSIKHECYDTDGNLLIPKEDQEDKDDCRLNHTILPIGRNYLSFGIASVGQRLSNGTLCSFTLSYRAKVGNNRVQRHSKTSSCTVGGGCEGDECRIDRVCTFSNGTQGVEEGLCTECFCSEGYSGPGCTNINECADGSNGCGGNADCIDTDGSYWCQCLPGFTGDGYICTDINECENVTCGENGECINTEGNYSCQCKSGFTGDGYNYCTDVDDCLAESVCPVGSQCDNSLGSYSCQCDAGLTMDGDSCKDVDECEIGDYVCPENAACINVRLSYECHCLPGFTGDGRQNCTDIDECSSGSDVCANVTHTVCNNQVGNYTCECEKGYYRDSSDTCRQCALIATIAGSTLFLALILILLSILLCLRILRPKAITFDDLTIKEIDPYYSPKFLGHSLESIHSEYEYLKSAPSIEHIEQLLESDTDSENEAHSVNSKIGVSADSPQEKFNFKTEKFSSSVQHEELLGEDSSQQGVSGNTDSLLCPNTHKEQSLSGTGKDHQPHSPTTSERASQLSTAGTRERDSGECSFTENHPPTIDNSDHDPPDSFHLSDQETSDPAHPSDHDPSDPSHSSDQETSDPTHHSDQETSDPSHLSDQETSDPAHHSDQEISDSSHLSDQETSDPAHHSDQETSDSSHPSDQETSDSSHPSDQELSDPSHPSDQEFSDPPHPHGQYDEVLQHPVSSSKPAAKEEEREVDETATPNASAAAAALPGVEKVHQNRSEL